MLSEHLFPPLRFCRSLDHFTRVISFYGSFYKNTIHIRVNCLLTSGSTVFCVSGGTILSLGLTAPKFCRCAATLPISSEKSILQLIFFSVFVTMRNLTRWELFVAFEKKMLRSYRKCHISEELVFMDVLSFLNYLRPLVAAG